MLLRDAEAVLDLPGIHTIARYPFALAAAGDAAVFHGRLDRAEQLCQEALDAASVPSDELAGLCLRGSRRVAYALGNASRAVEYLERVGELLPPLGNPSMLIWSSRRPRRLPIEQRTLPPVPPTQDERHLRWPARRAIPV